MLAADRKNLLTKTDDELRETNPLPIALIGVAVLLLGDVAVTLAAIGAMG
jgi:hypothetical protein